MCWAGGVYFDIHSKLDLLSSPPPAVEALVGSVGESPNLSPSSGFKFTWALSFIFRPNLHQVFVERHQWRRAHAALETKCKFARLLTEMMPLCFFLFAQTVDFSGKVRSSGFLDECFFFLSNIDIYPLHYTSLQWVLELKDLIIWIIFYSERVNQIYHKLVNF